MSIKGVASVAKVVEDTIKSAENIAANLESSKASKLLEAANSQMSHEGRNENRNENRSDPRNQKGQFVKANVVEVKKQNNPTEKKS